MKLDLIFVKGVDSDGQTIHTALQVMDEGRQLRQYHYHYQGAYPLDQDLETCADCAEVRKYNV